MDIFLYDDGKGQKRKDDTFQRSKSRVLLKSGSPTLKV